MKILCWTIVIAGWTFYGLVILVTLIYPPKHQTNPVEDFQHFFSKERWAAHWQFNITMLMLTMVYIVAWAYLRKDKHEKDRPK
jgi:flagellar biosynthesis protein FlhB